jgi:hypothetical protein
VWLVRVALASCKAILAQARSIAQAHRLNPYQVTALKQRVALLDNQALHLAVLAVT